MFDEIKRTLHDFGTDFDVLLLRELAARVAARSARPWRSSRRPARCTRRTAPGGCARPTSATTRTGSSSRATATRPTSPVTSPTCVDKRARGFDLCIYMLGADHHGYIARLKAAAAALGDDPDTVEVLIGQMVNLVSDGKPVRMSKRAGTVITMDDLVEAVGVDAARYALVRSSVDSTHRHRPRPVRKHEQRKPGLLRAVRARPAVGGAAQRRRARRHADGDADLGLLTHEREGELIRTPRRVPAGGGGGGRAARTAPGRPVPGELAGAYHKFYDVGSGAAAGRRGGHAAAPAPGSRSARPPRQVLANGLGLLGVIRTGADVDAMAHPAGPRHAEVACPATPPGPRRPLRANWTGCTRRCGRATPSARRRRGPRSGGRGRARAGRDRTAPRCSSWTRTTSGRAAASTPRRSATRRWCTTRPRRSCACEIARWVAEEGLGLDVCSGGELAIALRGGFPGGADRLARQQQVGRRADRGGRGRRRRGGARLVLRDRPAGRDRRATAASCSR